MFGVTSALCAASASAQNAPILGSASFDQQAMANALAYWTPERLQSAIPLDMGLSAGDVSPLNLPSLGSGSAGSTAPQGPGGQAVRAKAQQPQLSAEPQVFQQFYGYPEPFTRNDVPRLLYDESLGFVNYPQSTIGKLFFTIPGQGDFVCSASVARPHLLVTARHCVFDGRFFGNEVFFPAYHSGPNTTLSPGGLGGGWPARFLATWTSPCCALGPLDIGFIQTFDDDLSGCGGSAGGLPIEAYTGWLGTAWAGNTGNEPVQHYDAMGYPQAPPFTGNWMVDSQASTAVFDLLGVTDTASIGSDQTGGSSGGPWIVGFDGGSSPGGYPGGNYVNGLNSYKWISPARPLEMNGPQFKDYNFNQLRLSAEGLPCP
jgi:hypothetical protein